MIICIICAGIYVYLSFMFSKTGISVGTIGIFTILRLRFLSFMFFILAKSPEDNPYILDNKNGLKKSTFVFICLISTFIVSELDVSLRVTQDGDKQYVSQFSSSSEKNKVLQNSEVNRTMKLSDIQKWYEDKIPAISEILIDYAKSVDGLVLLNVDSAKFKFGEYDGLYNCHYTFYFTCNIDGILYNGEARAFMKYQDSTVNWFHFEIFSNDDIQPLVEYYDDSYDQIIENFNN